MKISVIIPCKNEGQNLEMTLNSLTNTKTNCEIEIIVVDDGSTDGCVQRIESKYPQVKFYKEKGLGASRARNFGALKATGDIFIFCDAHIKFYDFFLDKLLSLMQTNYKKIDAISPGIGVLGNPSHAGFGLKWDNKLQPTWLSNPKEVRIVPLLPGGCLMIKKEVFFDIEGFDKGFLVWGHEDEEISLKLWLFGYTCYIYPEVLVLHKFRSKHPYKVTYEHVHYNFLRMAVSHFNQERIKKVHELIRDSKVYKEVLNKLEKSDSFSQRKRYFDKRLYDDNWYFNKFNIPF